MSPDVLSPSQRSKCMSAIRGKDTKPELQVRSLLHRMGFRFRLHVAGLPGSPDIVLPRHRSVVLVNGCFWHHHPGCKYAYTPASRREFWQAKFSENEARDAKVVDQLSEAGWKVVVVWECELRDVDQLVNRLCTELK